jgi:peptide/nickel transport system substrate-binding protein
MTLAIDRAGLVKDVLGDADGVVHGQEAVSLITPELKGFGDPGVRPLPFDAAAARALLDEAGWKTPAGGGTRTRDGKPLAFVLLIPDGSERRKSVAQSIQVWLKQVGVEAAIETMGARAMQARAQRGDYDAAFLGIVAPVFLDQRFAWHSDPLIGQQNLSGYHNDEVDELVVKALVEPDPARALAMHREMIARVYRDQPVTFLYWLDQLAAIDARFRDVRANLLSALHQVQSWWVPPGEVKYKQ